MSYPYIGITGLGGGWEVYEKYDAAAIEQLLRDGHHIYFEDSAGPLGRAQFKDGLFQFVAEPFGDDELVRQEMSDFHEFAVWAAFYGRDFL